MSENLVLSMSYTYDFEAEHIFNQALFGPASTERETLQRLGFSNDMRGNEIGLFFDPVAELKKV